MKYHLAQCLAQEAPSDWYMLFIDTVTYLASFHLPKETLFPHLGSIHMYDHGTSVLEHEC